MLPPIPESPFAKLEDQDPGAIIKSRSEVTEPKGLGNDGISKTNNSTNSNSDSMRI